MFFVEYPILGSLKIAITFKFSVSHITFRTTKLFPLRVIQQARTEDNYRYGKQDVHMNPFAQLIFLRFIPFQLSLVSIDSFIKFESPSNDFFCDLCSFVSFRATKFQDYFFFTFFLLIHDSTSLLSSNFLELQYILNALLAQS